MSDTNSVLAEVAGERSRQMLEYNRTPDHDDSLPRSAWAYLLSRRSTELGNPFLGGDDDDPRRILLEIAAIAVAGIESIDRLSSHG